MSKPEQIKQAEVNIGVIGHVDHGKTSVVKALTGEWTEKHSEEIKRGITIRLGYADSNIYKCEKCKEKYCTKETCDLGHKTKLLRKVSFVDCPGHESLMVVMLSGASIMDGAMLVIAANEPCPQPQTIEHLAALNIAGIKNIIIVQNKIDLVSPEDAKKHYEQIKAFVKESVAENAPIIPVAAHYNVNINEIVEAIEKYIPTPKRDTSKDFRMLIARSFDINKPSSEIDELKGGVMGGSIIQGEIKKGDEIEISPGTLVDNEYKPLKTKVVSLSIKEGLIDLALPGGLVGIGTGLDPALTRGDNLIGNIIGKPGTLPPNIKELEINVHLFEKVVDLGKVEKLKLNETVVINTGTATTVGIVIQIKNEKATIKLKKPICVDKSDKVGISRKSATRWCLIGYGVVE